MDGTLYGTTYYGGAHGDGTVFSITPDGTEKVLYSFGAPPEGDNPHASLIDVDGTFYGTTAGGGADGEGTVFSITPGGTEKVLYSFGATPDGHNPQGSLINVDGTLYGTTAGGSVTATAQSSALRPAAQKKCCIALAKPRWKLSPGRPPRRARHALRHDVQRRLV